ncbi:MAG: hypothetical protein JXR19_10995 [Bacteroidia bacterium]
MKPATIVQIKKELQTKSESEMLELTLKLARFKKDNKELLTYLLFEADDEEDYIKEIKLEISEGFKDINTSSYYYIKKTVRKVLRNTKKHIRYSKLKQTEVELLLHFCLELADMEPSFTGNIALRSLMDRTKQQIKTALKGLHEDLQYEYKRDLDKLKMHLQN